jgi:hypothetical protein
MVEMGISTLRPFLHFTKSSPKTAHTIVIQKSVVMCDKIK